MDSGYKGTALYHYLAADHDRLDGLLQRATATSGAIDMEAYSEFRRGLLRHIATEERIVFPAIAHLQGGRQNPDISRLRLDHGALVALMVPAPTAEVIATTRSILSVHNILEEDENGVYMLLEQLKSSDTQRLLQSVRDTPQVPVVPHNDKPAVLEATRRAVERAGYRLHSP